MLRLYNSLSRQVEVFAPQKQKQVSLYVCGITPYDTTHLGHAFTYLSFDVLVRYLTFIGHTVTYTQNVTDINDRDNDILKRAQEQQVAWQDLASFWTKKFLTDMKALNWIMPTHYLYASQQTAAMTALIEKIIANGQGYEAKGSVYLDIEKFPHFGKLSRLSREEMMAKAIQFEEDIKNPDKRHPLDITLWRASSPTQPHHIPSFPSPWGEGRPGWHIECSAMATASLGEQIDIHGGGTDLMYPHHESEIAQSESATKKSPFAKYWLHTGTVGINGEKMSKSLGNLILISDLLKTYSANAIRWVLLSHHYRKPWEYKEEEFKTAEETLHSISKRSSEKNTHTQSTVMREVQGYMNDDLQVPTVLKLIKQHRTTSDPQILSAIHNTLDMLGFSL